MEKKTRDKLLRIFLRYLPIVPGPELYDLVLQIKRSQTDIDAQVEEALESIQNTSALVSRLEDSLKERAARLKQLQKDHERYSQLAQLEARKAEALLNQIEDTVGRNRGRERWIAFGINIAAGLVIFVLGVISSDPLKSWFTAGWALVAK